jgi:uncharacterized membrane protein
MENSKLNSDPNKRVLRWIQFAVLLAVLAVVSFTPLGSIPLRPPLIVATLGVVPIIVAAVTLGTATGSLMGALGGLFSFIVWTFMPPSAMAFVFTPFGFIGDAHGNFWSLVICFAPRVLAGTVTGLLYGFFQKTIKPGETPAFIVHGLGALIGALMAAMFFFIIGYAVVAIALKQNMNGFIVWLLVAAVFTMAFVSFYQFLKQKVKPETGRDFVSFGISAVLGSMANTFLVLGGIYLFFGETYAAANGLSYDTLLGILGMVVITNGIPEAILAAASAFFIGRLIVRHAQRGNMPTVTEEGFSGLSEPQ